MVRVLQATGRPQIYMALISVLMVVNSVQPQVSSQIAIAGQVLAFTAGRAGTKLSSPDPAPSLAFTGRVYALATELPTAGHQSPTVSRRTAGATVAPLADYQQAVDCAARPCIALSFDDGPNPETTPQILATLEQQHVPTTFFIIGSHVAGNETILRRMVADGLEIGNHTWDHQDMTTLTPQQISDELLKTQTAIAATGAPVPKLFRPPYGAVNDDIVRQAGLQTALWNEDPRDWQATDPAALAQTIIAQARPGGVVDLHDIHQVMADALPVVIDGLRAQNYQFVTVSQLLHSRDRPEGAPFYGYAASPTP